jgi:hypothetical protein
MEQLSFKKFIKLDEQAASPMITMPLQEVINAGKVTNMVQIVIMAQLTCALKEFTGALATRYIYEVARDSSSAVLIDSLKKMPAADQVTLAKELLHHISQEYGLYPAGCTTQQRQTIASSQ